MPDSVKILESAAQNGGKRTVIRNVFHCGAAVHPHFHTEFEESFHIIEGEMLVEVDGQQHMLAAGQSITIPRNAVHSFSALALTVAEIILEPGSPDFENAVTILVKSEDDNVFQAGLLDDMNLVQMAIIAELMNTTYTGETGQMILSFYNKTGEMVHEIKKQWLDKYIQ